MGREPEGVKEHRPFRGSRGPGPSPSPVTLGAQNLLLLLPSPARHPARGGQLTSRPAPAQRLPLPRHPERRPLGTGCATPIDGGGPRWCVISLLQERA